MILPPHILKYQKQLQELNKKAASSNKNDMKEKNNIKDKKVICVINSLYFHQKFVFY